MTKDTKLPESAEPPVPAEGATGGVRWTVLLPLAIFLAVAGFFVWGLLKGDPRKLPSVLIGKPVAEFNLPPVPGVKGPGGEPIPGLSTNDLKTGKLTLVNFFASWCVSCRDEHPFFMKLSRESAIRIVGIAYKDKPENTLAWLEELGNPYSRIGMDRKGRVAIDFGVYGIPESFIVNGSGRIIYKWIGPLSPKIWREKVVPAIDKAKTAAKSAS